MSSEENQEEFIDPGSPGLLDREIEAQRWAAFYHENQLRSPVGIPMTTVVYVPQKSIEPTGNDLPEGVEYFCSTQLWPAIKPVYLHMQEYCMGHTVSSHYNMLTDRNNNMTYVSQQITKETSFAPCKPPNFGLQDTEFINMDQPHSMPFIGPPMQPSFIHSHPAIPISPFSQAPSPFHPPIISPLPLLPDGNRASVFRFPPPMGNEIQPYNNPTFKSHRTLTK